MSLRLKGLNCVLTLVLNSSYSCTVLLVSNQSSPKSLLWLPEVPGVRGGGGVGGTLIK